MTWRPAEGEIVLDLTRSLRRLHHARPSGIDRVERAYLGWALSRRARFIVNLRGQHFVLGQSGGEALAALIDGSDAPLDFRARLRPDRNRRMRMGESLIRRHAVAEGPLHEVVDGSRIYLNVGHTNLDLPTIAALRKLRRTVMVHDLIPLEHPEFARPNGPAEMMVRLTAACAADWLVTNSEDTAIRLIRAVEAQGLGVPPITVLPLGIDVPRRPEAVRQSDHFVCLGTIEPRKNHALLLDIWQPDWPELYIVGRRGWENRDVFERLDKASANVIEQNALSDQDLWSLIASARALLFPSHAEGYGLPLAEALALGTPVIASDLPAHREVGRKVPDYLPATDQAAWTAKILDYIDDGPDRWAQLVRLDAWEPPGWDAHFESLDSLLGELMHKNSP